MALKAHPPAQPKLKLPPTVASPVDVGRLIRELKLIDESLLQLSLRKANAPAKMPKTSRLLDQTAELNKLNLLQKSHRAALEQHLEAVHAGAPVMHFSFGSDPSPVFVEKLTDWLRREIHSEVLLTVGLQPSLGAGCVLRTTNKYFDMSLRQTFAKQRELLMTRLFGAAA